MNRLGSKKGELKPEPSIAGLKVFVVEDEVLISMMLEDMLVDLGCEVVGPSINIDEALRVVQDNSIELAILDLNLNGVSAFPIADILQARKVPIIFSTGYGAGDTLQGTYKDFPTLSKPYDTDDLQQMLVKVTHANRRQPV